MYPNAYGSVDGGSVCGGESYLSPHSAFESSSDKLLGNVTPTRGHISHQNQMNSTRVFSSVSSTDGLSPSSRYYVMQCLNVLMIPF